jgi:hypothetical protein
MIGRPEAAEKLIKINGAIPDNGIRCAMLLDRAATLHGIAGMKRKESFTRVLAGHMFNKIEGMKPWALDCYSGVLGKYTAGSSHNATEGMIPSWNHIVDHLLFTMAKIEFGLGNITSACDHLVQLLHGVAANQEDEKPPGTPEKHANYVKLLTYIGKACGEARDIPVPQITQNEGNRVTLKNPLMVSIEISSLRFIEADNQIGEYSMSLGPLEERGMDIPVNKFSRIEWTLSNAFNCYHSTNNV